MRKRTVEANLEALRALVAAGGSLRGNVLFVADGARPIGLVVTLAAKDPTGARAVARGRVLQHAAQDPRTCRGVLTITQRQACLTVRRGGISPETLRRALHGPLAQGCPVLSKVAVQGARNPPPQEIAARDLGCAEIALSMARLRMEDDDDCMDFFLADAAAEARRGLAARLDATFFAHAPRRLAFPSPGLRTAVQAVPYRPAMEQLQQAQGWWFDALQSAA